MDSIRSPGRAGSDMPALDACQRMPPLDAGQKVHSTFACPGSARGAMRSSRGAPSGAMRSLSPALQVMQRSILNVALENASVPDAPRGERPFEYMQAVHEGLAFPLSPRGVKKFTSCPELNASLMPQLQRASSPGPGASRPPAAKCDAAYDAAAPHARFRQDEVLQLQRACSPGPGALRPSVSVCDARPLSARVRQDELPQLPRARSPGSEASRPLASVYDAAYDAAAPSGFCLAEIPQLQHSFSHGPGASRPSAPMSARLRPSERPKSEAAPMSARLRQNEMPQLENASSLGRGASRPSVSMSDAGPLNTRIGQDEMAQVQPSCSPGLGLSRLPVVTSDAAPTSARSRRPATPDCTEERTSCRKAPTSARTRKSTSEVGLMPQVPLSARGRASSVPSLYEPLHGDGMDHLCSTSMWPAARGQLSSPCPPEEAISEQQLLPSVKPRKEATRRSSRARAKDGWCNKDAERDDAMDALDGLLAELNGEKGEKQEEVIWKLNGEKGEKQFWSQEEEPNKSSLPRKAQATLDSRRCGIAPAQKAPSFYDHHVDVVVEVDDSPNSAVYCSPSATLMSVHLPTSPIASARDLDDSEISVINVGDHPKPKMQNLPRQSSAPRVRFECPSDRKHVPQAPRRRLCSTGAVTSRPLGCTAVALGGA